MTFVCKLYVILYVRSVINAASVDDNVVRETVIESAR